MNAFRFMADAPKDRPILIFCAYANCWHRSHYDHDAQAWALPNDGGFLGCPVCWSEMPADPPREFVERIRFDLKGW